MFFIVKVNQFNGSNDNPAKADVNGNLPVILVSYNGQVPTRTRVLSGTVALRAGLEVGKNYLVTITHTGVGEYGDIYRVDNAGEIPTRDLPAMIKETGSGVVQTERSATNTEKATRIVAAVAAEADADTF